MEKTLLFEIGTEELPSSCLNEGVNSLKNILTDKFLKNRLKFEKIETFGTPRRLIAVIYGLKDKQDSLEKLVMGPPERISYDDSGRPNQAAVGFARGIGIDVKDLEKISTDKGVYIGKKIFEKGVKTSEILPTILTEAIFSISFSKQMTWADWQIKFARPIRWLLAVYGEEILTLSIESLKSSNLTYGHRTLCPHSLNVKTADDFPDLLKKEGKVIADAYGRKEIILKGIRAIEESRKKDKIRVIINKDLLDEIINLVEIPNVLIGSFPEKFLSLPDDILIKAIEYHQRYFAVKNEKNKVLPEFVAVQNGVSDKNGEIIKGNERVLKARLSDASFFYDEDKKHTWEDWIEKLKGVIFYSKLGSIYDKELRLAKICQKIISELNQAKIIIPTEFLEYSKRASMLCKTDLVTNLVVEFPEIQGVVGREYAKERNEPREVFEAIFEHYLPRFFGDLLPSTSTGAILSIADKIDTIAGMFLAGAIPSGSEDPFALRRRASGIVLSMLEKNFGLDIYELVRFSVGLYKDFIKIDEDRESKTINDVADFIMARFKFNYEKDNMRTDLIDAIYSANIYSLTEINKRYVAIQKIIDIGKIDDISLPMIRCRNIVKGRNAGTVAPGLFKESSEKELYDEALSKEEMIRKDISEGSYDKALAELLDFRKKVDNFFDKVLIMDKMEEVKNNRLNLVNKVLGVYLMIADFSKIICN
ncbi:MAG: glycine--tRNA ligase subunit beta [Candidatus Humimicrobiaceae bacterium]